MKMLALSLGLLAAAGPALAEVGDNPHPGLLAKIQIATQAHQAQAAGREFKDMKKFARENEPARDGGNDGVQTKKHGSLDVSKLGHHGDIGQKAQIDVNSANSPRPPTAIGKAIGGHANDGDQD